MGGWPAGLSGHKEAARLERPREPLCRPLPVDVAHVGTRPAVSAPSLGLLWTRRGRVTQEAAAGSLDRFQGLVEASGT